MAIDNYNLISEYLNFKEECVKQNLFDLKEIIELFKAKKILGDLIE